jgi:hypothetical protein
MVKGCFFTRGGTSLLALPGLRTILPWSATALTGEAAGVLTLLFLVIFKNSQYKFMINPISQRLDKKKEKQKTF